MRIKNNSSNYLPEIYYSVSLIDKKYTGLLKFGRLVISPNELVSFSIASNQEKEITPPALTLLSKMFSPMIVWRSVGITLSNLTYSDDMQMDLFNKDKKSDERIGKVLDTLEEKFGKNIIHLG